MGITKSLGGASRVEVSIDALSAAGDAPTNGRDASIRVCAPRSLDAATCAAREGRRSERARTVSGTGR
jgi:hypothetical protein